MNIGIGIGIAYQTGGGHPLWTPASLGASLALWLDADDASTITLNGSTVSQWRDKSGNARHASQAAAANQPTYSATGFNGNGRIRFDGTNDNLSIASTALFSSGNADLSMFFVYNSIASSGYGTIFANFSEGNLQVLYSTATLTYASPWGIWNNQALDLVSGVYVQNKKSIIGVIRNSGVFTGYTDGTTDLSVSNSASVYTGSNTQSQWYIGSSTEGERGNVEIAEVICINSSLSTTDRQRLEGYLAWKWALGANLPSDHPFKNTPPTV
jgi:hypothetical protein